MAMVLPKSVTNFREGIFSFVYVQARNFFDCGFSMCDTGEFCHSSRDSTVAGDKF